MSVRLYGDIPFALLIDKKDRSTPNPTDLQAYRPDPRNYLKAGTEYPASIESCPDGGIRSVTVTIDRSKVKFAKIR